MAQHTTACLWAWVAALMVTDVLTATENSLKDLELYCPKLCDDTEVVGHFDACLLAQSRRHRVLHSCNPSHHEETFNDVLSVLWALESLRPDHPGTVPRLTLS